MSGLETNIFPLLNLKELSSRYRLYRVKGLSQEQKNRYPNEYFKRMMSLRARLSYQLQKPVTTIEKEGFVHVVVRDDAAELPSSIEVARTTLYLEPLGQTFDLDYTLRTPQNDLICHKFLQFLLREPLESDRRLWSPGSGSPFFTFEPIPSLNGIEHYRGFKARVLTTHDGGIGLCVDVAHKYISARPLPMYLSEREFRRWRDRHYIYHFGHDWYEIKAEYVDALNVAEYQISDDEEKISLVDFIYQKTNAPAPRELVNLPSDASTVVYHNNRGEERGAPAALCYLVYRTRDREMKKLHRFSIMEPQARRELIHKYVREHLGSLKFGDTRLRVSDRPLLAPARKFLVPDYEFGNSHVLSVRGTSGAQHVSLDNLGETRLALLKRRGPGFYKNDPLDRQYLFLPRSVCYTYGDGLVDFLKEVVDDLFPQEEGYSPKIVPYDDTVAKIWPAQAAAIKKAAEKHCDEPGYAVVMVHRVDGGGPGQEDTLGATVMRELHKLHVYSTIIHTSFSENCYTGVRGADGKLTYKIRGGERGRLMGYLRGVALNKILLNNQRWPFVLSTKLHADLIVGIDVKNHTAGFVIVGKNGIHIRPDFDTSLKEQEKLSTKRMKRCLIRILGKESEFSDDLVRTIVLHRDGRFFESELLGAKEALEHLKSIGVVHQDASITFVEIAKTAPVPFRLFDVIEQDEGKARVWNPEVGYYYIAGEVDGYLCATGRAFRRRSTINPLHVKRLEGTLSLEKCLEDIYYLTALTWTNPRDCSREPITIKLNDRYLGEEAGPYDSEALADEYQSLEDVLS